MSRCFRNIYIFVWYGIWKFNKILAIRFEVYFEHQKQMFQATKSISILYFEPRFYMKTNKLLIQIWETTWFLFIFGKRSLLPWPKTLFNLKPFESVFECVLCCSQRKYTVLVLYTTHGPSVDLFMMKVKFFYLQCSEK